MYELIQISEHDYYIESPAKIGIVCVGDGEVIAIDSGSDKDAGRKVLRHLEAKGWKLRAIINTHSHADHIGGNKFLQDRTGCKIYARGMEADFTNRPLLEPIGLYGGEPLPELQHKFLMAQESRAEALTDAVLPDGWQILDLPGHSFRMVGLRTPDDTVFLGDCVSSEATLAKYGIGYLWNVEQSLVTLAQVKELHAARFVPSHAEVTEDIVPLAQRNIDAIQSTAEKIAAFCEAPHTFEELLTMTFDAYDMTLTIQQYALIGSTLRAYLSYLKGQGRITFRFENNRMLWQKL